MAHTFDEILGLYLGQSVVRDKLEITKLGGTHDNVKCVYKQDSYHLKRLTSHAGELFSLDSQWRLQQLLAYSGLAPYPYTLIDDVWIEQWIDAPKTTIKQVALKMAQLHMTALYTRDACAHTHYPEFTSDLNDVWLADRVFGHNDLHASHVLGQYVVDWEYAGQTERAFDIAQCIVINHWRETEQSTFLYYYTSAIETLPYNLNDAVNAFIPVVQAINSAWHRQSLQQGH